MPGRPAVHLRAILLPCLMLLGLLGFCSQAAAATFRYDPLPLLDNNILNGGNGLGFPTNQLDSNNTVNFQVDQVFTPITRVTLRLIIRHGHINDLRISLISPDGTTVSLASGIGAVGVPSINIAAVPFVEAGFGTITPLPNYVEFMPSDIPTPASIQDPNILTGHQGWVPPGHYLPSGNLSSFNGKMNGTANGTWRLKIEDTRDIDFDAFDYGYFVNARLYITQQGGERVWTGKSNPQDNNWSNGENWEPLFGKPDPLQSNALIFPPNTPISSPFNNFNGTGQLVVATLTPYPAAPFYSVPAPTSTAAVTLTFPSPPQSSAMHAAWLALLGQAQIGDHLLIANEIPTTVRGEFRITAINLITSSMTIVRYNPTGTTSTLVTATGAVNSSIQLVRNLSQLEISGVQIASNTTPYIIAGDPVTVTDRALFLNAAGNNTWAIDSAMEAGQVTLEALNTNSVLSLTGTWSGPGGFIKTGTATVVIDPVANNNTYGGANLVSNGVLDIRKSSALGTGGGATVINGGTVLVAAGIGPVVEPITIGGSGYVPLGGSGLSALRFLGNATWDGVTLDKDRPSSLAVLAGTVTLDNIAPLTPATPFKTHNLFVTNAGTLAIDGELPTVTNLTVSGGTTTFGAAQPNIVGLTVGGGADLALGGNIMTVKGDITCEASSGIANITGNAGTFDLGAGNRTIMIVGGSAGAGGGANTTSSDLAIAAGLANGALTKKGAGVLRVADAPGVSVAVQQGTLATGTGTIGAVSVAYGAVLSPAGVLSSASLALASGSALILPTGGTPRVNATGAVTLNGAILQPYSGQSTTIIAAASVSGLFEGKPATGAGITYTATDVTLAGGGGTWVFAPTTSFTVDEAAGTFDVTITGGTGTQPVLRNYGGGIIEGRDVRLVNAPSVPSYTFTVPIVDNYVDSGDQTTNLVIVPQDGALVGNAATLTILDNDKSDQKKCGFGTGLTVFLLLGFGLLLQLRLRRR